MLCVQILVVGPSGCGKSECIKTFAVAEKERGKIINIQSVFTKAVESQELMGYVHPKSKYDHQVSWLKFALQHGTVAAKVFESRLIAMQSDQKSETERGPECLWQNQHTRELIIA